MNEYIKIPQLYDDAIKAQKEGDLKKAANLFLKCYNLYQNSELPVFNKEIKQKGENSKKYYKQITNNNLNEADFDNIIYEV